MRTALLAWVILCAACGGAPAATSPPPAAPIPRAETKKAAPERPAMTVKLRPEPGASPRVHVEIEVAAASVRTLRLLAGHATDVQARDDGGALAVTAQDGQGGQTFTLARASNGTLHVTYNVAATADVRAPSSSLVVADDRFRAFGESLVLVPAELERARFDLTLLTDGEAIRAPAAASSFGIGTAVSIETTGLALEHAAFVSGSLGHATFTEAFDIDHTAWLGYTAFDPRPAAAEIAQIRTALREEWKGGGETEFGVLFISTARPVGAYAMVPRAGSLVVHLGPSEPWNAALRVNLTQHLAHAWIGGEIHLAGGAETTWFHEGFARYLGARLLEQLGFLKPSDAQEYVSGLLSAQATSPRHGEANAALASDAIGRATLTARGALYAQHLNAQLRTKKPLEELVIRPLLQKARDAKRSEFDLSELDALIGADAAKEREAFFKGQDVPLQANALGPCFRLHDGEYRTFELGFDVPATLDSPSHVIVGLVPKSPAEKAGLLATDTLEDASYREGHPEVPVVLTVTRDGKKTQITYAPTGSRKKGQIVDRIPNIPDSKCGAIL